jgi:hypothetical protein
VVKEEERIREVIQGGDDDSDKGPMAVVPALAEACRVCGAGVRF